MSRLPASVLFFIDGGWTPTIVNGNKFSQAGNQGSLLASRENQMNRKISKLILLITGAALLASSVGQCTYQRSIITNEIPKKSGVIVSTFSRNGEDSYKRNDLNQRLVRVLMDMGFNVKASNTLDARLLVPSLANALKRIRFKGELKDFIAEATKTDYEFERNLRNNLAQLSKDLGVDYLIMVNVDDDYQAYEVIIVRMRDYTVIAQQSLSTEVERNMKWTVLPYIFYLGPRDLFMPYYSVERFEANFRRFVKKATSSSALAPKKGAAATAAPALPPKKEGQ